MPLAFVSRRPRLQFTASLTFAVGLVITAYASASPALSPPSPLEPDEAAAARAVWVRLAAAEAYVWGWPLAYVHHCKARLELVPSAGRSGGMPVAPINELAMLTDRISPRSAVVPCPNQDVLYGFGIFDLAESPVVLQVPDFGDRFWLFQLGDQRTDAFAELGSMYGTRPGCYLVVGPGWAGSAPAGVAGVLRAPTRHAYCIPRVFFTAASGDRAAAVTAVAGVMAYPIDAFTGAARQRDWTKLRWLPSLSCSGGTVPADRFLEILPELLDDVPPLPKEEPLYARFRGLLAAIEESPALAAEAAAAIRQTERDVVAPLFQFRNVGHSLPGGWTTVVNGAAFGTDYLTRTAVARSNVFVNRHHETKYFYLDLDAAGTRLQGDRRYVITFPAGRLPPAAGFWSLTAYDARHSLPAGSADRHSIGSRETGLVFNEDGSLTIVVTPASDLEQAADRATPNRIVAPPGEFSLYLRLYGPDERVLAGHWTPPPVTPEEGILPVRFGTPDEPSLRR